MRRWTLTLAVAAVLAVPFACSDDPTEPWEPDPNLWRLVVIAGDQQADTVTHTLPEPIKLQLVQDDEGRITLRHVGILYAQDFPQGRPVPGELVCWDVPGDGWGRVVPVCDETDSTGVAVGEWILGTLARPGIYAVGYTEHGGEAVAVDTVWATALPGPVASLVLGPDTLAWLGQPVKLELAAADAYDNPVPDPAPTLVVPPGWTVAGLTVTPTAEADAKVRATAGTGSAEARVLALRDLTSHRWRIEWMCRRSGRDQRDSDGVWENYDSTFATYETDSVRYWTARLDTAQVRFYTRGKIVRFWADGVQDTTLMPQTFTMVQRPDSLLDTGGAAPAVLTAPTPLRYTEELESCQAVRTYEEIG